MLAFKCGGPGVFFFWVVGVGFNVTPIRSAGVRGGGLGEAFFWVTSTGVAGTGSRDGRWITRRLGVSVASRRRRRRRCWDVKTGMRDGGVLRLVPDVVGISGTWGSWRRRRGGVGSTGGAVGWGWVAARTMRRIHLLKAGLNNSWPSCTSSLAVNGWVCNWRNATSLRIRFCFFCKDFFFHYPNTAFLLPVALPVGHVLVPSFAEQSVLLLLVSEDILQPGQP